MARSRLSGWKIASFRGVGIRIHPSLLFLLAYVLIVASARFPFVLEQSGLNPMMVGGTPLAWGLVFALALFASVVIHELAHVVMAQSMGVRVEGITLMMLGGVSEMERIPDKPYAEFKVSIVGPLASFAIALMLLAVQAWTVSAELALFSFWLARVNIALGVFNLLPAFPLDGGRALRSLLAARQGAARATRTAVQVAKGLAWAMGILGVLGFNLLLILIAFFVHAAASSELVLSVSRGMLRDVKARDVCEPVEPVQETDSVRAAVEHMLKSRRRTLAVRTAEGVPLILRADRLRRVPRELWATAPVGEFAERVGRFLDPGESLDDALPELASAGALPVRERGNLVGVVEYAAVAEQLELRGLGPDSDETTGRAA